MQALAKQLYDTTPGLEKEMPPHKNKILKEESQTKMLKRMRFMEVKDTKADVLKEVNNIEAERMEKEAIRKLNEER